MGHDVSLSENVALSELKFKWALHSGYRLLRSIFINCIQPGSILKEQFNILGYILYFLTKINDIIVMFMQQLNSQPYGPQHYICLQYMIRISVTAVSVFVQNSSS